MKNKLSDLTNHLFAQLERLGDETLTPEQIEQEGKRADAIVSIADQVIRNADLQLKSCDGHRKPRRSLHSDVAGPR